MSIKPGLNLLFGDDFFDHLPEPAKVSGDPQWRLFADIINLLRSDLLNGDPTELTYGINDLDSMFVCEKIPAPFLYHVADNYYTRYSLNDDDLTIRRKICSAVATNRFHATVGQVKDLIEECTGVRPDILPSAEYSSGWDEDNGIDDPPWQASFNDGHLWDEDDSYIAIPPGPFFWSTLPAGVLIDIKNDGAYTAEQLQCVYEIVAELKDTSLAADIGYFDTGTGTLVVLKTVYSTDLTQTAWGSETDPGI